MNMDRTRKQPTAPTERAHKTLTVRHKALLLGMATVGMALLSGCHLDMWIQRKQKPYYENDFFPDTQGNRPLVPNTVARGFLKDDDAFFEGATDVSSAAKVNQTLLTEIPAKAFTYFHREGATAEQDRLAMVEHGQSRFNIFCQPCHGKLGDGNGMIAQRGFAAKRPPGNYHTDRLRRMPVGYFYRVISNGVGNMYSYANRVPPEDRWAISAYVRALQLSQSANNTAVAAPETSAPPVTSPDSNPSSEPQGAMSNGSAPEGSQPGMGGQVPAAPQAQPGNMGPNDSNKNTMQNNGMNPNNTDPNYLNNRNVSPVTGQPNRPLRNGTGTR